MWRHLQFALVLALAAACSRGGAPAAKPASQTPARVSVETTAGPGYYGGDPANVLRSSTEPTGVGGGPASFGDAGLESTPRVEEDPSMKEPSTDTGHTGTEPPPSTKPPKK